MTAASVESFATAAAVAADANFVARVAAATVSAAAAIAADPSAKSAAVAPVASAETRGAGLRIVRGRTRRFFGPPRSPFSRRKLTTEKCTILY